MNTKGVVANEDLISRIEDSFGRQGIMSTLGARLVAIAPGRIEIELPVSTSHTQQQGFVHAGVIATIADSAGGYAALTMMEPGEDVLAIEFKINLLKPAVGDRLLARGSVVRSGATISVCTADVFVSRGSQTSLVAVMTQTNFRVQRAPDFATAQSPNSSATR